MSDPIPPEHQPGAVTTAGGWCTHEREPLHSTVLGVCALPPIELSELVIHKVIPTVREDPADSPLCPGPALDPYAVPPVSVASLLPEVSVRRGGIDYNQVTYLVEDSGYPEQIRRYAETVAEAQHQAIELACAEALLNDWDVHIHRRPMGAMTLDRAWGLVFIGIEHRPARYAVPTIVEHTREWVVVPLWWDLDEEDQ